MRKIFIIIVLFVLSCSNSNKNTTWLKNEIIPKMSKKNRANFNYQINNLMEPTIIDINKGIIKKGNYKIQIPYWHETYVKKNQIGNIFGIPDLMYQFSGECAYQYSFPGLTISFINSFDQYILIEFHQKGHWETIVKVIPTIIPPIDSKTEQFTIKQSITNKHISEIEYKNNKIKSILFIGYR